MPTINLKSDPSWLFEWPSYIQMLDVCVYFYIWNNPLLKHFSSSCVTFVVVVVGLDIPQEVNLSANSDSHRSQQLSISWLGGTGSTFDLIVLRTEFNETVFYVRASVVSLFWFTLLRFSYFFVLFTPYCGQVHLHIHFMPF